MNYTSGATGHETNSVNWIERHEWKADFLYQFDSDSICVILNPGNRASQGLFFGPAFIPIIPVSIFFPWGRKYEDRLDIDIILYVYKEYEFNLKDIQFIMNGKTAIVPKTIKEIPLGGYRAYKVEPPYIKSEIIKDNKPIRIRLNFDQKVRKIKQLEVKMNIIKDEENYDVPPLYLRQTSKLEFRPCFA